MEKNEIAGFYFIIKKSMVVEDLFHKNRLLILMIYYD